jgi:hypothetical protein
MRTGYGNEPKSFEVERLAAMKNERQEVGLELKEEELVVLAALRRRGSLA